MSLCNSTIIRESMLVLAVALTVPCAAQQLDRSTAGVLSSAADALAREQYGAARGVIATLDPATLSPFERSRAEQILFNVAYQERRYDEARSHLERAMASGGLTEREVAQLRYQGVQLLMVEERWRDGAAALEEWLATTPQPNASAYYLLAVAYYQSGEPAKALPAARAAIEREDYANAPAIIQLGYSSDDVSPAPTGSRPTQLSDANRSTQDHERSGRQRRHR